MAPRITKPVRIEQSYYNKIEKEAYEGKRPISSQIEIMADYWFGMQQVRDEMLGNKPGHNAVITREAKEQKGPTQ